MRMISRVQRSRARKGVIRKVTLVLLFLLLIGLLNYSQVNPLSQISHAVAKPIWGAQHALQTKVQVFFGMLKSKQTLVEENTALVQEVEESRSLRIAREALLLQNIELKLMLGRDIEKKTVLGAVLNRPITSPYDTILIDIGSKHGVHVGNTVIALGDFVVGFVSKVFINSAQVTLYSSPGIQTNVLIGTTTIPALAVGRGANNFIVNLPRDAQVKKNDIIVVADLDTQVFSVVDEIIRTPTDAFQSILFRSPINIFNIKWVQVILSQTRAL